MTIPQPAHFCVQLDPAAVLAAYAQHRRRFGSFVATLDKADLSAPSRCSEWTVADILRHGCDVDRVIGSVWEGRSPFRGFDPRITPHEWVLEGRAIADIEVRDRYIVSARSMASNVEGSGPERWGLPSRSPAGRVPWWLSLLHVFYDSWLHERDVLIPMGRDVAVLEDEVDSVLAYSLAIVALVARLLGTHERLDAVVCGFRVIAGGGSVTVERAVSVKGAPVLTGDPALIVDALAGRGRLGDVLAGEPDVVQHLGALARFFLSPV